MRMLLALVTCLAAVSAGIAQSPGSVRGVVLDRDFGTPVEGARVLLVGTPFSAVSGPEGAFLIERVPPGSYPVAVTKDGYERLILPAVSVLAGRLADVRVELVAEVYEMEELLVSGEDLLADSEAGLLEIRAESVALQDSISAELIGKAGVSDAAGALKLVTGATVVGGKYATVRGLSDRYTGTTLNGIRVPSPDPRRRAVQVDLFPTGTVESVTVTKTFTPDLQGDFTGGGIDIRTKSIPEERLFKVSISGEYNTFATGNDRYLTYENGGVGAVGISGDSRDLPALVKNTRPPQPPRPRITSGPGSSTPTPAENEAAATIDAFTNSFEPVLGVSRNEAGPGFGLSLLGGSRHDTSEQGRFGWLAAFTYSRKQDMYEDGVNNSAGISDPSQGFTVSRNRVDSRGNEEVLMGLLATSVLEPSANHRYTARLIANQGAEDEARYQVQQGELLEQNQSLQYVERTLVSPQFEGNHTFPDAAEGTFWGMKFSDLKLDWRLSPNFTRQFEPDVRFFRNTFDPVAGVASRIGGTTESELFLRVFRDIKERNNQLASDLTMPFTQWSDTEGRFKAGLYFEKGARDYQQRSFTYRFFAQQLRPRTASDLAAWQFNNRIGSPGFIVSEDCATGACGLDQLWSDVFLAPERIGIADNLATISNQTLWYAEPLGTDVFYTGDQTIAAMYAMAEIPLSAKWRLNAGARWEKTRIDILPSAPFDPQNRLFVIVKNGDNRGLAFVPGPVAAARIDESHVLPALGASWEIRQAMHLRFSWSSTIARPTFRELAPVATAEFLAGDQFIGNNELRISDITNWDLRWEWFRRPGDVLAASVFYKTLKNPIEYISFAVASNSYIQPVNYERGEVKGFELEARTGLDVLWEKLKGFNLGANYTNLDSTVEVPADEQASLAAFDLDVPERRLLGQPDSVLNVNLTYDNEKSGTSVGLFYNRVGEILLTGAARGDTDGIADVLEGTDKDLVLTVSQKLKRGVSLGLRIRNGLEDDAITFYRRPSGETAVKTLRQSNRTIGLSVSWSR
ncbi:MAG TPA: TonB-dependent receptor [Candidatus Polarisedimenticolaceae bacterium]